MSKLRKPRTKKFNGPVCPVAAKSEASQEQEDTDGNEESAEQRFDKELFWCIEQLQLGLETKNPDSKQALETNKILRILQNDKTPMIKKRQAMRNACGDYREKMKAEERKSAAKMRKLSVKSGEVAGKSVFYRKSCHMDEPHQSSSPHPTTSLLDSTDNLSGDITNEASVRCHNATSSHDFNSVFQQTQQEFKFNFSISSESVNVSETVDCKSTCDFGDVERKKNNSVGKHFVDSSIHDHFVAQRQNQSDFKFNFSVT